MSNHGEVRRFASRLRRARPASLVVAMVVTFLASGSVMAPEAEDGVFDVPLLAVAPGSQLDPVQLAGRVEVAAPTTTTTAPVTTTTTAPPPLFDPVAPARPNRGGDEHPDVAVPAIGMVEIPRIGLVHPVFEGLDVTQIHWGPGHWPGSAMPGQAGNAVFAGHRVTHTRPFLDIDKLTAGDRMVFRTVDGTFTYEVSEHLIVLPEDTWIAQQTPDATVTIFACHPKYSARQRYVVRGRLVESAPGWWG